LTITETEQFFTVVSDDVPDIFNSCPALTFCVVVGLTIFIISVGIVDGKGLNEF
jgi:hypothetical protein